MIIYLAKSNNAKPEDIITVINMIKGHDILQYNGGKYTNTDLLRSDVLVVVPDNSDLILGRGLHSQIHDFKAAGKNAVYIYHDNALCDFKDATKLPDKNWKVYSKCYVGDVRLKSIQ